MAKAEEYLRLSLRVGPHACSTFIALYHVMMRLRLSVSDVSDVPNIGGLHALTICEHALTVYALALAIYTHADHSPTSS
jgi:hypothetical protein